MKVDLCPVARIGGLCWLNNIYGVAGPRAVLAAREVSCEVDFLKAIISHIVSVLEATLLWLR